MNYVVFENTDPSLHMANARTAGCRQTKLTSLLEIAIRRLSQDTGHDTILDQAMSGTKAPALSRIAGTWRCGTDFLAWFEDGGTCFASKADAGEAYQRCNQHGLLIGPGGCGYELPDFIAGVFMPGPRTLYRDHRHVARE